jgi:acetyltransferase-like isoleucine patch superfamily enzyme
MSLKRLEGGIPVASILLVGWMPSPIKILFYRLLGYKIGKNVSLGLGCVIRSKDVVIDHGAKIGMLAVIQGNVIRIGARAKVGMMSVLDCAILEIGEGTRIGSQVVVGGMKSPTSSFKIGRNCILMEWSFINTTRSVKIGDNVGIGGHCLFFTHGLWPSTFEGYPSNFGEITIEDNAWLAWRVSVLPGVTVGQGTIVSSDACVTKSLPAMALAAGVPAKAIRENGSFLASTTIEARGAILKNALTEFNQWIAFNGGTILSHNDQATKFQTSELSSSPCCIFLGSGESNAAVIEQCVEATRAGNAVVGVFLTELTALERERCDSHKVGWLDLEAKIRSRDDAALTDATEEFLRRTGVRLLKFGTWLD